MTVNSPRRGEAGRLRLPPLYPIVDVDLCLMRGRDPLALALAFADGGARLIQLRQKSAGSGPFLALCREVLAALQPRDVTMIVNDRADLAALAGAHGVHVGQDDLPVDAVRALVGDNVVIGLSTHTREQVDVALGSNIDYLAVGPVFGTATKNTGYEPRGLDLIRHAADRGRPVVAIGGMTIERAPEALQAGAASVAIISDLLADPDPAARVRAYLDRIG